ncbi:MAG: hypothetical protein KA007_00065 [Candidatus Pacebacteria bacterium]|nr:hypothetical protein [Candidatus Paceibacterota bacterium]
MAFKETPNKTTAVVRAAMKIVAKDVRPPKAVRDKLVKPIPSPKAEIPKKPSIDLIILDDSITIKNKNIIDISSFSTKMHGENLFDFKFVAPSRIEYCSIDLEFLAKDKKAKKIMKLCTENKKIRMLVQFSHDKMVVAIGYITSFESLEGRFKFSYTPDYFEVR